MIQDGQNGKQRPEELEHGDSWLLAGLWMEGKHQTIITEHYVRPGEETSAVILRMIRVKFFHDSDESVDISHAFKE